MATTKFLDYAGLTYFIGKLKARQVDSKGLSTEDFTSELKGQLTALQTKLGTFDPTTVATNTGLNALTAKVDGLLAIINEEGTADGDKIINKLNEVFAFLNGVSSDEKLKAILDGKADKATTLAGYGITDANISDAGVITLGAKTITPLTEHQSLAEYAKSATVATDLAKKADTTYVDDELAKKLNTADLVAITEAEIDALITTA